MERVVIRYGDKSYAIDITSLQGESLKHSIMGYIYKAMQHFHGNEHDVYEENYQLKSDLHELVSDIPSLREKIVDILRRGDGNNSNRSRQ